MKNLHYKARLKHWKQSVTKQSLLMVHLVAILALSITSRDPHQWTELASVVIEL